MGNVLHQWRRGLSELKESVRLSEAFSTVQQRKGDRLVKAFIFTFALSISMNFYAQRLQHQIESDYMEYRRKVNSQLT